MKKVIYILLILFLISCEKEFKELQRSYVISNFIELNDDLDYKEKIKKLRRQRNTFAGATFMEFLVILGLISK